MADRGTRLARSALAHAGASSVLKVDLYTEVVIRPVDRVQRMRFFYFGNPKLSTCALFVMGLYGLEGCAETECEASYMPEGGPERDAMVDIQSLARRFGAWTSAALPMPTMRAGDVWIIADERGDDAHTGICTSDAVDDGDGGFTVDTVEGGQVPVDANGHAVGGQGCSAQLAFSGAQARHFVRDGARLRLGHRYLLGYAAAAHMPVPDDNAPDPGDAAAGAITQQAA